MKGYNRKRTINEVDTPNCQDDSQDSRNYSQVSQNYSQNSQNHFFATTVPSNETVLGDEPLPSNEELALEEQKLHNRKAEQIENQKKYTQEEGGKRRRKEETHIKFKEGIRKLLKGDFGGCRIDFEACENHSEAEHRLALLYRRGQGVDMDHKKAAFWFKKAADHGNTCAQYNYGVRLWEGEGVTRNFAKAFQYFQKSADSNNASAQYNLGLMYSKGEGVEKNQNMAFRWLSRAAENGHLLATTNVGLRYLHGFGVDKDLNKSVVYFTKSADKKNCEAAFLLSSICSLDDTLVDKVTSQLWKQMGNQWKQESIEAAMNANANNNNNANNANVGAK